MKKWLAITIAILIALSVAAGCTKKSYMPSEKESRPGMKVLVFYPGAENLYGEEHEVPQSNNVPKAAVEELFRGKPNSNQIRSFLPKGVKILGLQVENGVATVNFSKEILNARLDAKRETMGVAAIVRTLTEFKYIQKVRFRVEGKEKGKVGDKLIEDWWGNGVAKNQPFEMK
jgi:hypothetical protein